MFVLTEPCEYDRICVWISMFKKGSLPLCVFWKRVHWEYPQLNIMRACEWWDDAPLVLMATRIMKIQLQARPNPIGSNSKARTKTIFYTAIGLSIMCVLSSSLFHQIIGVCFHRSRFVSQVSIRKQSISCWWTLLPPMTVVTSSITHGGWWRAKQILRCLNACTSIPTHQVQVNSGCRKSYRSTSWS